MKFVVLVIPSFKSFSFRFLSSLEYLQQDLKFAKRLPQLASHGLAFEYEGFDRHQLTIARHAFVVPAHKYNFWKNKINLIVSVSQSATNQSGKGTRFRRNLSDN